MYPCEGMDLWGRDDAVAEGAVASEAQVETEDELAAKGTFCESRFAPIGPTLGAKTVSNLRGDRGNPKALMRGFRVLP